MHEHTHKCFLYPQTQSTFKAGEGMKTSKGSEKKRKDNPEQTGNALHFCPS